MKKISLLTTLLLVGICAMAQTPPADPTAKVLEFKNAEYKMGKNPFGKPMEYVVEVKNISHDTVTLINVQAACGCTTPKFVPNEKIAPGQTGKINIHYSNNTMGAFTKTSTIFFSGGLTKLVSFTGEGIQETQATAIPSGTGTEKGKVEKN